VIRKWSPPEGTAAQIGGEATEFRQTV
jgi:hypothetical protein